MLKIYVANLVGINMENTKEKMTRLIGSTIINVKETYDQINTQPIGSI